MALRWSLVTICVVLTMANLRYVDAAVGLDPEMTAERMNEIWADPEELKRGEACILGQGPCTPEMQNVLDLWPEVYTTACAECDQRERDVFRAAGRNSYNLDPAFFNAVIDQIDPNRVYLDDWLEFVFSED